MAGYGYVSQVQDPAAQRALRNALDLIAGLRADLDALIEKAVVNDTTLNANAQRIHSVASPESSTDAATAGYVSAQIAAQLESFKGAAGVNSVFTTAGAFTVTVENGLITSVV